MVNSAYHACKYEPLQEKYSMMHEATNIHRKKDRLEFAGVVTCATDAMNDCFYTNKKVVFI